MVQPKSIKDLRNRQKTLRRDYGVNERVTFSKVVLKMSADEIRERRKHLRTTYGFTESEQRFIARQKPNFLLYDREKDTGIQALSELLTEQFGFKTELLRTLVLKNPSILSKSKGQIKFFFDYLKRTKQISEDTTMKMIFDVPALLNVDIAVKSKEVEELFGIYHKITPKEVNSIFLDFPYLYCAPTQKLQLFLAEFRKYRFSKDQILNLVS